MSIDEFKELVAKAIKTKQLHEVSMYVGVNNAHSQVKIFSNGEIFIDKKSFLDSIKNGKFELQVSYYKGEGLLCPTDNQESLSTQIYAVLRENGINVNFPKNNE